MESTLKVSDLATLKWKFNSDDTFDMIFSWNRDSWCGLGFGKDVNVFHRLDEQRRYVDLQSGQPSGGGAGSLVNWVNYPQY